MRGKNYGVEVTHEDGTAKKYRFSTLGVHDQFEAFSELVTRPEREAKVSERAGKFAGEKEKQDGLQDRGAIKERQVEADALTQGAKPDAENEDGQRQREMQNSDNVNYVKRDSFTDLKSDITSQQNPQTNAKINSDNNAKTDEDEMKLKDIMGVRETLKEKRKSNAATKDDVARAADAAGRKAEAQVKKEMNKTAETTAKRTVDQVAKEFERMTAKQKEAAKHAPKHKR